MPAFTDLLSGVIMTKRVYKRLYGIRPNSFYTVPDTQDGIAPPELLTALHVSPRVEELAGGGTVATPLTPALIECTGFPLLSDIIRGTFDTSLPYVQTPDVQCRQRQQSIQGGARVFTFPPLFVDQIVNLVQQVERQTDAFMEAVKRPSRSFLTTVKLLNAYSDLVDKPWTRFTQSYFKTYRGPSSTFPEAMRRMSLEVQNEVRSVFRMASSVANELRTFGLEMARHKQQDLALQYGTTPKLDVQQSVGYKVIQLVAKMQQVVMAFITFMNTASIQNCDLPEPSAVLKGARDFQQAMIHMRSEMQQTRQLLQLRSSWVTAVIQGGNGDQKKESEKFFGMAMFTNWFLCLFLMYGLNVFALNSEWTVSQRAALTFQDTSSWSPLTLFPGGTGRNVDLYEPLCHLHDKTVERLWSWQRCTGTVPPGTNPLAFSLLTDRMEYFKVTSCSEMNVGTVPREWTTQQSREMEKLKKQYSQTCYRYQITPESKVIVLNVKGERSDPQAQLDPSLQLTPRSTFSDIAYDAIISDLFVLLGELALHTWLLHRSAQTGKLDLIHVFIVYVASINVLGTQAGITSVNKAWSGTRLKDVLTTLLNGEIQVSLPKIDQSVLLFTLIPSLLSAFAAAGIELNWFGCKGTKNVLDKQQSRDNNVDLHVDEEKTPLPFSPRAIAPSPGAIAPSPRAIPRSPLAVPSSPLVVPPSPFAVPPSPRATQNVLNAVLARDEIKRRVKQGTDEFKFKVKTYVQNLKIPEKKSYNVLNDEQLQQMYVALQAEFNADLERRRLYRGR